MRPYAPLLGRGKRVETCLSFKLAMLYNLEHIANFWFVHQNQLLLV